MEDAFELIHEIVGEEFLKQYEFSMLTFIKVEGLGFLVDKALLKLATLAF